MGVIAADADEEIPLARDAAVERGIHYLIMCIH